MDRLQWLHHDGDILFDDSLLDTGPIDGNQIDSIMLEVFHNGGSLGVWDSASGQDPGANVLNFNFDTTTESLLIGGHSATSTLGQEWNWVSPTGVGFGSGESLQAVVVSGSTLGAISTNNSTLTAKRKFHAVPEPNIAITWTIVGLISAGLYRRRR